MTVVLLIGGYLLGLVVVAAVCWWLNVEEATLAIVPIFWPLVAPFAVLGVVMLGLLLLAQWVAGFCERVGVSRRAP